ncbi:Uncharacterised protein [Legionella steigerwaltii]|uniref:Uncharacterized protein n=1 Tax=Legionella steigerwaltii TaxID=460 RepID=A0A378LEG0_9GAMM|nr:hypothetical protein [Legionella steigerwaltii]KTD78750.1 hypothetical protein Lstg_1219 [Legionella steigerwaltii]STY24159.1 Uncharacterised protein [Legionella steigerwaltii]
MTKHKRIDENRLTANRKYKLALTLLDSTQEMDDPATIQAIKFLKESIELLENIAFDFGEEDMIASDYLLFAGANCGLARAYAKMSTGINPGDISFRLEMTTKYINSVASKSAEESTLRKENSPHVSLSLLNTTPPPSDNDGARNEPTLNI